MDRKSKEWEEVRWHMTQFLSQLWTHNYVWRLSYKVKDKKCLNAAHKSIKTFQHCLHANEVSQSKKLMQWKKFYESLFSARGRVRKWQMPLISLTEEREKLIWLGLKSWNTESWTGQILLCLDVIDQEWNRVKSSVIIKKTCFFCLYASQAKDCHMHSHTVEKTKESIAGFSHEPLLNLSSVSWGLSALCLHRWTRPTCFYYVLFTFKNNLNE